MQALSLSLIGLSHRAGATYEVGPNVYGAVRYFVLRVLLSTRDAVMVLVLNLMLAVPVCSEPVVQPPVTVPILLYHRFGPVAADSMTITTTVFRSHLEFLKNNGYTVIPLRQLVNYYLRKGPPLPGKSVVIVVDDGHKTVYSDMLPLVREYHAPVTLFLYPSAISKASYAMTWEQIRDLKKTGLFEFQGHTYWHPNFKTEKKRLRPDDFAAFVEMQLKKSRHKIEKELGTPVDMLAWPFGIYDDWLIGKAVSFGYIATLTIEAHHAGPSDNVLKLPRYLLSNADRGKVFEQLMGGGHPRQKG